MLRPRRFLSDAAFGTGAQAHDVLPVTPENKYRDHAEHEGVGRVAGQRDEYRPVESLLSETSEAQAIANGFRSRFSLTWWANLCPWRQLPSSTRNWETPPLSLNGSCNGSLIHRSGLPNTRRWRDSWASGFA